MRVVLDAEACTGHGRCYALAPEVFDADDDGHCVRARRRVRCRPSSKSQARLGVANCPELALRVEE